MEQCPPNWKPFVVYKDVDIPNQGREASSYFYALSTLSYRAGDTIAFVQGDPFAHCVNLWAELRKRTTGFRWLGDRRVKDDANGTPHHPGLPVGDWYDRIVGEQRPAHFEFAAGAQFLIPARFALKHPKSFYENLFADANADEQAPWALERLWQHIFA